MYVGDTSDGSGLHHLLWEVVANALDEYLAGRATRIEVTCNEDGSITVDDDGSGFPIHLVDGVPFAQLALTTFHGTATLDGHAPHAHVGLRGVGIAVVNALSSSFTLDVFRGGRHHRQRFVAGERRTELEDVEATERSGTRVTFVPDATIFADAEMSFERIDMRLREIALLNAGLRIELRDDRRRRRSCHHPEGIRGFLADQDDLLTCCGVAHEVQVDVALRWAPSTPWDARLQSFANTEPTTGHGTHIDGLLLGIADAAVPQWPLRKRHSARVRNVIAGALQAVVHVKVADPTYAGPTKDRLASPEVREAVRAVVADRLAIQLAERPEIRERLVLRLGGDR